MGCTTTSWIVRCCSTDQNIVRSRNGPSSANPASHSAPILPNFLLRTSWLASMTATASLISPIRIPSRLHQSLYSPNQNPPSLSKSQRHLRRFLGNRVGKLSRTPRRAMSIIFATITCTLTSSLTSSVSSRATWLRRLILSKLAVVVGC